MNGLPKRIMLVDDDPEYLHFIKEGLEGLGYEVLTAQSESAAEQEIRSGAAQFFVFDLFLKEVEDRFSDTSAARLVHLLDEYAGGTPWVGLSSEERNRAFRFWRQRHPEQVRSKSMGVNESVEWIHRRFMESTPHNWEIQVDYLVGDELLKLNGRTLSGHELWEAVQETLRMLIGKSTSLDTLTVTMLPEQGHGSCLKLRVVPSGPGEPSSFVLKVGRGSDVDAEHQSYDRWIRGYSIPQPTQVSKSRALRRYSVAALLYTFVKRARQLREDYVGCESDKELKRLRKMVKRLFTEIARGWFATLHLQERAFRSSAFADALAKEEAGFLGSMLAGFGVDDWEGRPRLELAHDGESISVVNPCPFSRFHANPIGPWARCLAHGDLHSGNVLVIDGSNELVLIDFSETQNDQPLFRDFAKFEADLALDLLPEASDVASMTAFLRWQIDLQHFVPPAWPDGAAGWPPRKGPEVIRSVRAVLEETIRGRVARAQLNAENLRQLHRGYFFSLWREYVRAWRWMADESPLRRLQNMVTISTIVEQCCGPDERGRG